MRFTLTIDTDNAAFADGARGREIARILTTTARRVLNDVQEERFRPEILGYSFDIQAANGNNVGRVELVWVTA